MLLDYAMKDSLTIFNYIGEKENQGVWSATVISGAKVDAQKRFKAYRGTITDCGADEYTAYLMDAFVSACDLRGRVKEFLPEADFEALPDGMKPLYWTLRVNGFDCVMLSAQTEVTLDGNERPPEGSQTHRVTGVLRREWNVGALTHWKVTCA